MKKFYKIVSLGEEKGGFSVLLDGKPVKTPSRLNLQTPHKNLANALLQEWSAQGDKIIPATMPLTQILTTRIDRIPRERKAIHVLLMKYLDTDLLCYRSNYPPELVKRQKEIWDPWLDWFAKEFGAPLATTGDLKALKQPEKAHKAVEARVQAVDDELFTILQLVTSISGSLVLGLAFTARAATPEQVFSAAHVEEDYKADLYNEKTHGPDPAQEKKDAAARADLEAAAKYLDLLSRSTIGCAS